jgi:CrcB protein
LERIIVVGLAGALGALSRYGLQSAINDAAGRPSVLGTLIVNLTGSLLLGFLIGVTEERVSLPSLWRTAGAVGFLGAYTTFSTLMFESIDRLEGGEATLVLAYLASSILFGLLLAYTGLQLGRAV